MSTNMKKFTLSALSALACLAIVHTASGAAHARDAFIKQYDTNHDGKVERVEFDAARTARFNSTDADRNSAVDEGEYLSEYIAQLDAELAASGKSEAEKTESRQRQLRQALVRFNVLDADKDMKIGKAEYDASGARSFNNHDSDKDGAVTTNDAVDDSAGRDPAR